MLLKMIHTVCTVYCQVVYKKCTVHFNNSLMSISVWKLIKFNWFSENSIFSLKWQIKILLKNVINKWIIILFGKLFSNKQFIFSNGVQIELFSLLSIKKKNEILCTI